MMSTRGESHQNQGIGSRFLDSHLGIGYQ